MITAWRIVKEEHNFLINPNHPNFPAMKIGDSQRFEFDPRIIEKLPDLKAGALDRLSLGW